jgi:glucose-1-phosphate adenylyltransferase
MDYSDLAKFHWENDADITVAVQPVYRNDASRFGIMKVDKNDRITAFVEKPTDPNILSQFESRMDDEKPFLGSMGIYFFNSEKLIDILETTTDTDFGGEVIPKAIDTMKVYAYPFEGYWEDIGTIRSFFETNLAIAKPGTPFKLLSQDNPIYSRPRFLPSSIIENSKMKNVLLADGSIIKGAKIKNAVIGLRSRIGVNVKIKNSIIMGADYYDSPEKKEVAGGIPIGIGANSTIEGAIIDKNVRIGEGVKIKPFPSGTEIDNELWSVQDGIVVIPKRTILPDGIYIGPEED